MRYQIFGPFKLPRDANGLVASDKKSKAAFWAEVEDCCEGLSHACGCYVFSIRAAQGALPWYVGLAEKQTFRQECFQLHKKQRYTDALLTPRGVRKGTPQLYLVAKLTATDRFAKPSQNGHESTQLLENLLIGVAVSRNPAVTNIRGTVKLRKMVVPGVLNAKAGKSSAAQALKATLYKPIARTKSAKRQKR